MKGEKQGGVLFYTFHMAGGKVYPNNDVMKEILSSFVI